MHFVSLSLTFSSPPCMYVCNVCTYVCTTTYVCKFDFWQVNEIEFGLVINKSDYRRERKYKILILSAGSVPLSSKGYLPSVGLYIGEFLGMLIQEMISTTEE
jgi:hypothetical protein